MEVFEYFEHNFELDGIKHESFVHSFQWMHQPRAPESRCQVDIFELPDNILVLLTDLGVGTSVTNASEQIATEVRRLKNLDPHTTIWAECYAEDFGDRPVLTEKYPFDQIFYKYYPETDEYKHPDWRPIHPKALPLPRKELM